MRRKLIFLLAAAVLIWTPLLAQEQTGSVQGTATDADGAAVPGVTVELGGTTLIAVTDDGGRYTFPRVPVGRYSVRARLEGFAPVDVSDVVVTLGVTKRVDVQMKIGAVEETIVVSAEGVQIDISQSATAATLTSETFEKLPTGRDFTSMVSQLAGANNEAFVAGISIDGASGAENRFILDGVDTTQPRTGMQGKTVLVNFVDEVQVKQAGYAAEYGGSTGGVINVITKTGTNDFSGTVGINYQNDALQGDVRPILQLSSSTGQAEYFTGEKDSFDRYDPGFSLGGPIVRDQAWFFVAYAPAIQSTTRDVTFDPIFGGVRGSFGQDATTHNLSANLKGNVGSHLLYKAALNANPSKTEGIFPGTDGRTDPNADTDQTTETENTTFSGYLDWLPSNAILVSLRGGLYSIDTSTSGVTDAERIFWGPAASPRPPQALYPQTPASLQRPPGYQSEINVFQTDKDKYERQYVNLDGTLFFRGGGEHQLKLGIQSDETTNDVAQFETAGGRREFRWGSRSAGQGTFGHMRLRRFETVGKTTIKSFDAFLQDSWQITPRFTLSIGVRAGEEKVPAYAKFDSEGDPLPEFPIQFDWDQKVAPRLGFAWDVLGDSRWKVYGSYGDYYDTMKMEIARGSYGADRWLERRYALNSLDWVSMNCVGDPRTGIPNCGADFPYTTTVDFRFLVASDITTYIDPNLDPTQSREYTLGAQHQLTNTIALGARFVHKEIVKTVDDVGFFSPVDQAEVYYTANPGYGVTQTEFDRPFPKAVRDYDAIELTINRRFANRWSLNASYTYSQLEGNFSGLASSDEFGRSSPNVNRFFDGIVMVYDQNLNEVIGKLGTDRPHQFKGQFSYLFDMGLSVGVAQYLTSGVPETTQAAFGSCCGYPWFPYGRGDLGRSPTFTQTDLRLGYTFGLASGRDIELYANVFNLFDEDTELSVQNNLLTSQIGEDPSDFFAHPFDVRARAADEGVALNPLFGNANRFQAPRQANVGVTFHF